MAQFKMVLKCNRGNVERERDLGWWEDNAREEFAATRRRMERAIFSYNLTLVNPEGEVILEHNQNGEEK